jgi:tetratricopeptide (TPR) repeat protein
MKAMNIVGPVRLIAVAIILMALCPASRARSESNSAEDLIMKYFSLWREGKYAEAVPLAQRVLEMYERQFGRDHAKVAMALNNLAELLRDQGRYAEAEPIADEVIGFSSRKRADLTITAPMSVQSMYPG